jgi:hypothetical protein
MNAEHSEPDNVQVDHRAVGGAAAAQPRVIAAADTNEVMQEQLQFLIEHAGTGTCGCQQCDRYIRVRALLMELFDEALNRSRRRW